MRVESNGDVIWSHNIVDRGAVFSQPRRGLSLSRHLQSRAQTIFAHHDRAWKRHSFCRGLRCLRRTRAVGARGQLAFYTDAWDVGSVESASFTVQVVSRRRTHRRGSYFPAMTVFQSGAPRWKWCRTERNTELPTEPPTAEFSSLAKLKRH